APGAKTDATPEPPRTSPAPPESPATESREEHSRDDSSTALGSARQDETAVFDPEATMLAAPHARAAETPRQPTTVASEAGSTAPGPMPRPVGATPSATAGPGQAAVRGARSDPATMFGKPGPDDTSALDVDATILAQPPAQAGRTPPRSRGAL